MTVPLRDAVIGTFVAVGADERRRLRLDQLLQDPLEARADSVGHFAGLERGK